jgi:hypothetical protein
MALLNLCQTSSVEEYKNSFDQLVYNIRLYDGNISETMLISQFLLGIKDELRHSVELHLPNTISQAATLAAIQEHLKIQHKQHHKKLYTSKPSFSSTKLWKARQLKEYRKANNLCYKCGDKYTPTHTCSSNAACTINLMENNALDGGAYLSDELLDALESPQFNMLDVESYISPSCHLW